MIDIFLRLSGILAMLFAWLFVVAPAVEHGIDSKNQTISSATKNDKVRHRVSTGLILGTLFQISFLFYLLSRFQLSYLSIGSILYLSSTFATILVALFPEHKHFKIHSFFAKYYFLVFPSSLLLIAWNMGKENNIFIFTCLSVFLYFFGVLWNLKKFGISAKVEQWAFLVLSAWTIVLTIV